MDAKKILYNVIKLFAVLGFIIFSVLLIRTFSFSLLRTFGYSLLVMTIGAILDAKENWLRKGIKYVLYIGYAVYTLWSLGVIDNIKLLLNLDYLDWTTLTLGFVAPLCMMFVGKRITAIAIKGHRIFNYYTLWIIYLILGFVWNHFYPADIRLDLLFVYFALTITITSYFKIKHRGV
jgi:hypothetical protein